MLLLTLLLVPLFAIPAGYFYYRSLSASQREALLYNLFCSPLGYYATRFSHDPLSQPHRDITDSNTHGGRVKVLPVPYAEDNYAYICVDTVDDVAAVIDPGDASRVISALKTEAPTAKLFAILLTHKHWDHTAGSTQVASQFKNVKVYGGVKDFPRSWVNWWYGITNWVKDADVIEVGAMRFRVIESPCHTKGSVMYMLEPSDKTGSVELMMPSSATNAGDTPTQPPPRMECEVPSLFPGDTLFVGGCGKFFEGTPLDMHKTIQRLRDLLPSSALIWPGHEYAANNLAYAQRLEPSNITVHLKQQQTTSATYHRHAVIPSTWADETLYNPYLRVDARAKKGELWKAALNGVEYQVRKEVERGVEELVCEGSYEDDKVRERVRGECVALGCLRRGKDLWKG